MSNSLDQGQLEDRTRSLVLSRHDQGFGSDLGAAVDLLGDDGDDAGEAQGLRAPVAIANVQDLARPSRRLSTGSASKTAGDTGDSSDDDSGSDREKGKWFDVASETQKFKRRAETLCTKMRTRMDQLIQQRQGQLDVRATCRMKIWWKPRSFTIAFKPLRSLHRNRKPSTPATCRHSLRLLCA